MTFASPSETESKLSPSHAALPCLARTSCIRRCHPSKPIRLELLSWGFPKIPLHRDADRASTPRRLPVLRPEDANLVHVPSLPFLPASTVYSARPLQVCCTLHPTMGFGPFQAPSLAPPCGCTSDLDPPRNRASHPSELSPRPQPYRVTAALAFPSFESLTNEFLRSQGLSPSSSPLRCPALPPTTARCSHGLCSPPGSSPNSPWLIHCRDPKASRSPFASPEGSPQDSAALSRSRTSLEFCHVQDMGSSKALQRNPVAFFLPAPGLCRLSRGCFKFRVPSAVKRSGHARDRLCQRPHSETLGLECVHDRTRCTQHTRGRLERIREAEIFWISWLFRTDL